MFWSSAGMCSSSIFISAADRKAESDWQSVIQKILKQDLLAWCGSISQMELLYF